ncbi:MAG: HD domain-containing protein [Chloroflexi bacterium]|nr:HD domain-containing protein [Chloroflexota bacterium]
MATASGSWRDRLNRLSAQCPHPAWGPAHCQRVYELARELAALERTCVDAEALFAAACLHDLGAMPPYRRTGVDHAERSAELAVELLPGAGFARERIPLVRTIIRRHMYADAPSEPPEAVLFHDADTLDFLGAIGVARILSIVGLDDWAPDLPSAVQLLQRFQRELPDRLLCASARRMAAPRTAEMEAFLRALGTETDAFAEL